MEKYAPGSSTDPRMKMVGALTYRKLLSYPESAEVAKLADQIDEDLKKCSPLKLLIHHNPKAAADHSAAVVSLEA